MSCDKERRASKKNSKRENKKHPYRKARKNIGKPINNEKGLLIYE